MENFKFGIDQKVGLTLSGARAKYGLGWRMGTIKERKEDAGVKYLVVYKDGSGGTVEDWFDEAELSEVK